MALAKKLCLLGDFSVGKTSLIRRYIHDDFSLDYRATVGVQIHQHKDDIETGQGVVRFVQVIWDIEGSRFGEELVTNYILGSAGALVIGDATRADAIPSMTSHARAFLDLLPGRPVVFAMNKSDLLAEDEWPQADELVDSFGGELVYTSALTGYGVRSLFHALGRRVLEIGA
ncbi:MAG: hypothetical protein OEU92_07200 [Alphaproteobacteria bacterium]|nr:hypothetical protein [Alphaproteobacteria bacterium]